MWRISCADSSRISAPWRPPSSPTRRYGSGSPLTRKPTIPIAVRIAWEDFTRHAGLDTYRRLEESAGRAQTWKNWRDKALEHVRDEAKRPDCRRGIWHMGASGNTLLVEILLHEGDSDAALAEAKSGGCNRTVWMRLARAREKDHPLDAAAIYRAIVDRKSNQAYDEAAALAGKIKALMARAEKKAEFATWLGALRVKHKAKRNFMQRITEF